jgi:site-specific DNA recombinase
MRIPEAASRLHGLLTCGRCGCTITAERKKGKYTYYRCTAFRGRCGNSYIREEDLAELLGKVVEAIQIPEEWAEWIAQGVRESVSDLEAARQQSITQLTARQRIVQGKLDRGYDDYLEGRISGEFWSRKSAEWESDLAAVDAELSRVSQPTPAYAVTAARILELAKTAHFLYSDQDLEGRRKLLDSVLSNCTFDRGTLCPTYVKPFDLLSRGRETGDWRGGRDSNPRPPA